MGMVHAAVTIFAADEMRRVTVRLVVDSGSTLTWVHKDVLAQLGIRPRETRAFLPIDARREPLMRPVADALVACEGLQGVVGVVFADPGDHQALGVTALERLGLSVDPQSGTLTKEAAFLALATV